MAIDFNRPVTKDMLRSMRQLRQRQLSAGMPVSGKPLINAQYGQHTGWDTALDTIKNIWNTSGDRPVQKEVAAAEKGISNLISSRQINQNVDRGSSRQNIRQFLPGVTEQGHANQYLVQDIIDPKTGTIAKLSPQQNAQIRKKYNQWAKRYKYYGGEPSLAKWLSLHTSQATRNTQSAVSDQADKQRKVGRGWQLFFENYANAHKAANPGVTSREGTQAVKAAQAFQKGINQLKTLPKYQQISYYSTGLFMPAIGAGAVVAAPYATTAAPWLAKNFVLPSIGYSVGEKVAQPFADLYNQDLRAVADALTTRNLSNLTKPQQVILDNLKKQYHLGDSPDILWDNAAKSLYNKAGRNEKFIKTVMSTAPTLIPGKGFVSRAVMSPVWGYLNYTGTQPSTTAAQDVLQGNISDEDKAQMQAVADSHGVPLTRKVQAELYNIAKTKAEQQGLLQKGLSLATGSKWGQDLTHGGIQGSINQLVDYGGMDAKQQKEALPGLLQNMKNLASTPWKLNALAAYTENKDNMQRLVKSFDKYSPQQLGNLYDAVKQIQKQNSGLVPPQVQKLQAMLQQAAQTSAVTKYNAGLSQTDPQKFQAHMKSWMPLFHRVTSQNQGMSQQFKALRDRTQKAVWAHVKKNPFFINKAMSIWAMSNGFNSLADFLGSNGAFYGTLGAIGIGLPLTISLIKSLFGGGSKPQQVVQHTPMQGYQPMAYAPRGITERGLIVG